jgi:hypothetical protein
VARKIDGKVTSDDDDDDDDGTRHATSDGTGFVVKRVYKATGPGC